ncbi:50S ribosomal protein L11 [Candidatus Mycoplasma mahonii]|uniref:50S ribosomal protein L11 n=1 Tax=Candidatus Mycoplasma mahonii TaxID=3004105 RepID=UPI0026EAF4E5|nr:50S ribosomal protein L11 [Candidatus Mycoplasma mahonii]WKX02654.1 50S ribosomal protein L11 [Candidatus Mycoplasma mahonii]
MAKIITRIAKLQFNAGQAKPGPELAGLGIVMPEFTKQFNDATRDRSSEPVPVSITVYNDRSFTFKTYTAPSSYKLKEAAGIKKGSDNSKTTKVATIKKQQLQEIAEYKIVDMNTDDIEQAMKQVAGTAKNMGILIEGIDNIAEEKAKAAAATASNVAAAIAEAALDAAAEATLENKDASAEVETTSQKEAPVDDEGNEKSDESGK